jgi:hypothetical protein
MNLMARSDELKSACLKGSYATALVNPPSSAGSEVPGAHERAYARKLCAAPTANRRGADRCSVIAAAPRVVASPRSCASPASEEESLSTTPPPE